MAKPAAPRRAAPRRSSTEAPRQAPRPPSAHATSAVRVALDPETGTWGPPAPSQARGTGRGPGAESDLADAVVVERPDGVRIIYLGPRFMDYQYLTIGADGRRQTRCFSGPSRPAAGSQAGALPDR